MNLEKDLKELRRQKQLKESAIAQLRKRFKTIKKTKTVKRICYGTTS